VIRGAQTLYERFQEVGMLVKSGLDSFEAMFGGMFAVVAGGWWS
jgi:hypothetical protein